MAQTPKGIYYQDDYSVEADILDDMKKMAESIDDVIEHDREAVDEFAEQTEQDIARIQEEQTTQNTKIQANEDNIEQNTADIAALNSTGLIIDEYEEVDVDVEDEE